MRTADTNRRTRDPQPRQAGFSMIEVLITVFVVAIGLLGIASVQFISKRSNFEAVQRTTATLLANDIIERMRANPGMLLEYAGDAGSPIAPLGGPTATRTQPALDCTTSACSPFELSQYDLWEWETALNGLSEQVTADGSSTGGLHSPTACITTTGAAGAVDRSARYDVAIAWRGGTQLADPDTSDCGRGSGKYNGEDGSANTHRRVLIVSTFISAN